MFQVLQHLKERDFKSYDMPREILIVLASVPHPANTCGLLSGDLTHNRHMTFEVPFPLPVFLRGYNLVGDICWYNSCKAVTVWVGTDLQISETLSSDDDNNNNVIKQMVLWAKELMTVRASRFLVHFFDVHQCTTTTWNIPMRRFMEDMDILWLTIFPFPIWTWIKPLTIQLQEKSPTFDELSGVPNRRDKVWKDANSFFSDVFTAVVIVVA